MFWKIFAWINLIVSLPLLAVTVFFGAPAFHLIDIIVIIFNDVFLIVVPLLFAYKIYDIKYLSNAVFLKMIFIFTIFYNTTQITNDLLKYTFTSIPGFLFDMSFYILIVLSITSFALYLMTKFKTSFFRIFIK